MTPLQRQMETMAEADKYRILAYRLANALADEIHFSQMPSEDSLTLLSEALALYPDSEFAKRYANWNIDKMEAVQD